MQASLVHSLSSMRISARPQPALSFKASVGGQQIVGKFAAKSLSNCSLIDNSRHGLRHDPPIHGALPYLNLELYLHKVF
jgi:hypothetical protein